MSVGRPRSSRGFARSTMADHSSFFAVSMCLEMSSAGFDAALCLMLEAITTVWEPPESACSIIFAIELDKYSSVKRSLQCDSEWGREEQVEFGPEPTALSLHESLLAAH